MYLQMKTLANECERGQLLERLNRLRMDSQRRWGSMSSQQMICHLSDSFRAALGEKSITQSSSLFKRTIYKWAALRLPFPWPHGIKTRPEVDQQQGGTKPTEFVYDIEMFRELFDRFCGYTGEFGEHSSMGQLSRRERMRHAYLHIDHHLRQFGV